MILLNRGGTNHDETVDRTRRDIAVLCVLGSEVMRTVSIVSDTRNNGEHPRHRGAKAHMASSTCIINIPEPIISAIRFSQLAFHIVFSVSKNYFNECSFKFRYCNC